MFRFRLGPLSMSLTAFFWLLVCSRPAAADSIPIGFTGIVGDCSSTPLGICSSIPATSTVTGTYSIVPGVLPTKLPFITGPWEFSTPFGSISSSMSGSFANLITPYPFSTVPPSPLGDYPVVQFSADDIFLQLTFNSQMESFSEFGYGRLVTAETSRSGATTFHPSTLTFGSSTGPTATLDFTSGAAVPTPEPSSLLLLGTALISLAPFVRRGYRRSLNG
jgi:PEP-CTERM motif-containing protein